MVCLLLFCSRNIIMPKLARFYLFIKYQELWQKTWKNPSRTHRPRSRRRGYLSYFKTEKRAYSGIGARRNLQPPV